MYNYLFRILIVGDATVGKTSICNRISNNAFTPYSPSTIGVDFNVFSLKLLNDRIIKCQLWDTAGSERFREWWKPFQWCCLELIHSRLGQR